MVVAEIYNPTKLIVYIIFAIWCCLMTGCHQQVDKNENALIGDWKQINTEITEYPAVNVFLQGVSIKMDSLAFFSDYLNNPLFDYRRYSVSGDSIFIEFDGSINAFYFHRTENALLIQDGERDYMYVKLQPKIRNNADRIEFISLNPGRYDSYFFNLSLSQNGSFTYISTSDGRELKGHLKDTYLKFVFDKLHNMELPIQSDSDEVIPAGDHLFTIKIFYNENRLDSVTYSRGLKGSYTKWLANLLQSTPLWIEDAIGRDDTNSYNQKKYNETQP